MTYEYSVAYPQYFGPSVWCGLMSDIESALTKAERMSSLHNSPCHLVLVRDGLRRPTVKVKLDQLMSAVDRDNILETINPPAYYSVQQTLDMAEWFMH